MNVNRHDKVEVEQFAKADLRRSAEHRHFGLNPVEQPCRFDNRIWGPG